MAVDGLLGGRGDNKYGDNPYRMREGVLPTIDNNKEIFNSQNSMDRGVVRNSRKLIRRPDSRNTRPDSGEEMQPFAKKPPEYFSQGLYS